MNWKSYAFSRATTKPKTKKINNITSDEWNIQSNNNYSLSSLQCTAQWEKKTLKYRHASIHPFGGWFFFAALQNSIEYTASHPSCTGVQGAKDKRTNWRFGKKRRTFVPKKKGVWYPRNFIACIKDEGPSIQSALLGGFGKKTETEAAQFVDRREGSLLSAMQFRLHFTEDSIPPANG